VLAFDAMGLRREFWPFGVAMFAVNLVMLFVLFVILDRGRIVSPAYGRISEEELRRLKSARRRAPATAEPAGGI
jgi:hypothetical protein